MEGGIGGKAKGKKAGSPAENIGSSTIGSLASISFFSKKKKGGGREERGGSHFVLLISFYSLSLFSTTNVCFSRLLSLGER